MFWQVEGGVKRVSVAIRQAGASVPVPPPCTHTFRPLSERERVCVCVCVAPQREVHFHCVLKVIYGTLSIFPLLSRPPGLL